MPLLDQTLFEQLSSLITDGSELNLSLSTTSEEYRSLRTMLGEANSATRAWLREPDADIAATLKQLQDTSWLKCHDWLLDKACANHWSPEWLGWMAFSALSRDNPWQGFSLSLKLLDLLMEQLKKEGSASKENEQLLASLKRMQGIFVDESGEPPVLMAVASAPLLNGLSLSELQPSGTVESKPETTEVTNLLDSLHSITGCLKSLIEHLKFYDLQSHCNRLLESINNGIKILSQFAPEQKQEQEKVSNTGSSVDAHDAVQQTAANTLSKARSNEPPPVFLKDRADARKKLEELVAYFRTAEPHSPVSWLLDKALAWLDLSFPELLQTMTGERQDLHDEVCRLSGLAELAGKPSVSVYPKAATSATSPSEPQMEQQQKMSEQAQVETAQVETGSTGDTAALLTQDLI